MEIAAAPPHLPKQPQPVPPVEAEPVPFCAVKRLGQNVIADVGTYAVPLTGNDIYLAQDGTFDTLQALTDAELTFAAVAPQKAFLAFPPL